MINIYICVIIIIIIIIYIRILMDAYGDAWTQDPGNL